MIDSHIKSVVGPGTGADGDLRDIRLGTEGQIIASLLRGKHAEQALRGNIFLHSMSSGALLTTVGTSAPWVLSNPANSKKNLIPIRLGVVFTAFPATPVAACLLLAANSSPAADAPTGTAGVPVCAALGVVPTPVGSVLTAATLAAAPVPFRTIATKGTGDDTTAFIIPEIVADFDGSLVLTPGTSISLFQNTGDATNPEVIISCAWEEVDV